MEVFTYSPEDVDLTFAGTTVEGWNNITLHRNAQVVKQIRGIRGKSTKVINSRDTSATITISVAQTSETNTILSTILNLDLTYKNVRMEIMLKDKGGGSVFKTNTGYIGGWPDIVYSSGIEERQWAIFCDTSQWTLRGNAQNSSSLLSALTNLL